MQILTIHQSLDDLVIGCLEDAQPLRIKGSKERKKRVKGAVVTEGDRTPVYMDSTVCIFLCLCVRWCLCVRIQAEPSKDSEYG